MTDDTQFTGAWYRCDEEESAAGTIVLRPASHDFAPRRRPRDYVEFASDGSLLFRSGGAAEEGIEARGRWVVKDDELALDAATALHGRYGIVPTSDDAIVLQRRDAPVETLDGRRGRTPTADDD